MVGVKARSVQCVSVSGKCVTEDISVVYSTLSVTVLAKVVLRERLLLLSLLLPPLPSSHQAQLYSALNC